MATETKLCSDITREVRNKHPDTRGCFFHVSNERNNKTQAYIAKSIGIFAGVSDFIYLYKDEFNLRKGLVGFLGLEVKVPNSRHKVEHIQQQVGWGEIIESIGGNWRLITSVEEAVNCVEGNLQGYTTKQVREMLKNNTLKNLIIPKWQK